MKPTGTIKFVALIFVVLALFLILGSSLQIMILLDGESPSSPATLLIGIPAGILLFVISSGLHKLRRWAYLVGVYVLLLFIVSDVVGIINGSQFYIASLVLHAVLVFLLYRSRSLFSRSGITVTPPSGA
mgnify:CR=1 FL=1